MEPEIPTSPSYDRALELARAGQLDDAATELQSLLGAASDHRQAWTLMAVLRGRQGNPAAQLACYNRMIDLDPADAGTHLARGALLVGMGQAADALVSFDAAIAVDPALAFAHSNRAQVLNALERNDEALAAADHALALDPTLAFPWRHRGLALLCLDRAEEALESYRTALTLGAPAGRPDGLHDLSMALRALGRYGEAIAALDESAAGPNGGRARFYQGQMRLMTGDYAAGWDGYEARWTIPGFGAPGHEMTPGLRRRLVHAPQVDDLRGRRVLVVAEQGVGDEIMFASCLPDLARVAGHVAVIVDPRLVRLISRSTPDIEVFAARSGQADAAAFERIVALGSLPSMFRRAAADFPGRPYLTPDPAVTAGWRERLGPKTTRLRIGLSWRGGVKQTMGLARSVDLATTLRPLLDRPDCEFVNLQYGDVAAELAAVNTALAHPILGFPRADFDDFEDLAGLVGALDAVITVQTALAHLTGAVGQTGLVMIPRFPEWRYGTEGHMVWYRSLRLLRQDDAAHWDPVVAKVMRALDALP